MWLEFIAEIILVQIFVTNSLGFINLVHDQGLSGIAVMGAAPQQSGWTAGEAIDGNTNQSYSSNSCAITDTDGNRNTSIWWRVWLQRRFNVAYIEIYFRSDTFRRSTGFSIYTYIPQEFYPLSDPKHLVYHHDPLSGCPASVMNITVNNITQGIAFINTRPQGYTSNCLGDNTMYTGIEICEIRVMGCDASRYSIGCTQICPSKCNGGCDAFNGSCIHGCSNPNASSIDCIVCDDGEYITNKICVDCPGHCKDGAPCNKLTGMCDSGCANQWTGTFCNLCPANYYGRNCNTPCGYCKDNDVCNNINGHCPNGCQSQWQGDRCDECAGGFYNLTCTGVCGHCVNGEVCLQNNGYCANGCRNHFLFPMCQGYLFVLPNQCSMGECTDGFYNLTCTGVCGHCVNGEVCSQNNGYCANGCSNHFLYPLCQECEGGYYDNICRSVCGQCINGEMCDKYNGTCVNGCEPNFKTPLCQECSHGFYGQQCEKRCGKCKGGMICNTSSGICPDGCHEHWSPPTCTECILYKYGPNCVFDCGHCKDGMPCSTDKGLCTKGCEDGWTGNLCLTVKVDVAESQKQSEEMTTTGTVAIAVLSTLLVIAILINIFMGRKLILNQSSKRHTDTPMSQKQDSSQTYTDLTVTDETHAYSTLGSDVCEAPYQVISDASHKIK